ncbi:hypothetical protein NIES4071_107410 (plasmid) [Calothrix sp. NIES-4071]|nr:hypothetical protein NIES4071_107410 [Calothrix sp. NIES-4071]BAZ64781.1 hypothetical protein NIES4105_105140 [Calothrix sp. NIES-4105]
MNAIYARITSLTQFINNMLKTPPIHGGDESFENGFSHQSYYDF